MKKLRLWQSLKTLLERFPLFLITVPLFIVLHIEQQFHQLMEYGFVYKEIIQLFAAPFIMLIFCLPVYRNRKKACIACFAVMMLFFFFSDLKDWVDEVLDKPLIGRYSVLIPVLLLSLVYFLLRIKKSKSSFNGSFRFINTLFILFIISDLVILLAGVTAADKVSQRTRDLASPYSVCTDCITPDIYHIVFDSYTSSSVLKSTFGYDNSSLDSFLSSKGFFIADHSRSNYNQTPFSLASTFNMQYVEGLDTSRPIRMQKYLPGIYGMYNTELQKILAAQGYDIVNNSIFRMKDHPPEIPPFDLWDYYFLYERHNLLKRLDKDIGWSFRLFLGIGPRTSNYAAERDKNLAGIYKNLLKHIRRKHPGPQFVYSHFMIPHHPYTFDASGNKLEDIVAVPLEEEKKKYVTQLQYVNKLIMQLVNDILVHSKQPVVIILQGDHGFKFNDAPLKQLEFPNLNAVYFFNKDYRLMERATSPVNTYRVLLNTFFRQKYPLLPHRSVFLQY